MMKARKTTQEERVHIANECLEEECSYREIVIKHDVSL